MNQHQIVIAQDGKVYKEQFVRTEIPASSAQNAIRSFAGNGRLPLTQLFPQESFEFWNRHPLRNPAFNPMEYVDIRSIGVMLGKSGCCVYGRLSKLRLNTTWNIQNGGIQVPMFQHTHADRLTNIGVYDLNSVDKLMRWWFICTFKINDKGVITPEGLGTCYLVLSVPGEPGVWKPALPNIYEDGRVCMGTDAVRNMQKTTQPISLFCFALQELVFSSWNSDLAGEVHTYNGQYATSVTDNKPLNWNTGYLTSNSTMWKTTRVSNATYNDIPFV